MDIGAGGRYVNINANPIGGMPGVLSFVEC